MYCDSDAQFTTFRCFRGRLILLEFVFTKKRMWKMALSLEADLMGGIINKKAVELYLTHTCKHFGNTAAC